MFVTANREHAVHQHILDRSLLAEHMRPRPTCIAWEKRQTVRLQV